MDGSNHDSKRGFRWKIVSTNVWSFFLTGNQFYPLIVEHDRNCPERLSELTQQLHNEPGKTRKTGTVQSI